MCRNAILAAIVLALLASGAAQAALVYQRGASQYDNPTVVSARSDGTHRLVLAHGYGPTLSPDGKLVAYYKGAGAESLYVEPVRGGPARRLVYGTVDTGAPIAWSPDGRRLVVGRVEGGAYVVDLDGDLYGYGLDSPGERSLGSGWSPLWGPRGLAFGRGHRVLLRRGFGDRAHTVLHRGGSAVAWSADGRRLLVSSYIRGTPRPWEYRAVLVDLEGGDPVVVPYAFRRVADLSRDGRSVLGTNVDGAIVRVRLDGAERVLVQRGTRPDWFH
jgi:dipeptidyl aminopeptidase/acylaminoacyl peptidase